MEAARGEPFDPFAGDKELKLTPGQIHLNCCLERFGLLGLRMVEALLRICLKRSAVRLQAKSYGILDVASGKGSGATSRSHGFCAIGRSTADP
ncbi:hypothetical protein CO654_15195 [Rhizobium sp. L18]|nr:hypothetical protein CO654_15195 [Rhizobium sp. L18]